MFLFRSSLIVRLFPRRFFHGPTVVNGMARFLGGSFLGPPVIVRLFPRRFFHGPMMVNGMRVPLDMTDSKRKRNYIEKICLYNCFTHCINVYGKERKANVYVSDMFIQLFYTLYLIYMEKKVKQMFMEMICLYNCFIRCI